MSLTTLKKIQDNLFSPKISIYYKDGGETYYIFNGYEFGPYEDSYVSFQNDTLKMFEELSDEVYKTATSGKMDVKTVYIETLLSSLKHIHTLYCYRPKETIIRGHRAINKAEFCEHSNIHYEQHGLKSMFKNEKGNDWNGFHPDHVSNLLILYYKELCTVIEYLERIAETKFENPIPKKDSLNQRETTLLLYYLLQPHNIDNNSMLSKLVSNITGFSAQNVRVTLGEIGKEKSRERNDKALRKIIPLLEGLDLDGLVTTIKKELGVE